MNYSSIRNQLGPVDLPAICSAAKIYQDNLCNTSLLFCYADDGDIKFKEAAFPANRFPHLIGIKAHHSAAALFDRALRERLSISHFDFSPGTDRALFNKKMGMAQNKLFLLASCCNFIGASSIKTSDWAVASGNTNMLFLDQQENSSVPNSSRDQDNRLVIENSTRSPVIAVFQQQENVISSIRTESSCVIKKIEKKYLPKGFDLSDLRNAATEKGYFTEKIAMDLYLSDKTPFVSYSVKSPFDIQDWDQGTDPEMVDAVCSKIRESLQAKADYRDIKKIDEDELFRA